ncbi:MAG TPA: ABC transporter substrate-binding protein [Acidimicrobiales bacterium]|nr:ABC transporter substrate-binding protein [Acidimicrobiales bacterium]
MRLRRAWRRLRGRPVGAQVATLAVAAVVVAGAAYGISSATSQAPAGSSGTTLAGSVGGANGVGVDQASTSSRGVTPDTINVVFPVANLTSLSSTLGFASDVEFSEQAAAIHTFVNEINDSGGIHGRKINAMIENFDPTSEADMRAKCLDWTQSTPVFAVVDGLGTWNGDNQLCITQEGSTPLIGQWTTVSDWTQKGSPYLWWTGPDQAVVLRTLVEWGKASHLLGGGRLVGVVAGDRSSDQLALTKYLLPDFARAGLPAPVVETLASNVNDSATTNAEAPLVVQRLKARGVQSVMPLIPFNSFFPYLQAETQQQYFPRLLLSDYESTITEALGLIPVPYEKALDGQLGISVETLGGIDDTRPASQGGYVTGARSCYETWIAHNKQPPGTGPFIDSQGPIVSWCQAIRLFAEAARRAGPDLNRKTFVEAMASITNFQGALTPILSFGPHKFYGPVEYRVLRVHNNDPKHNACVLKYDGQPQGTCWQIVQDFRPLASG